MGEGGSGRALRKTLEQLSDRFHLGSPSGLFRIPQGQVARTEFLTKSSFTNNCGKFLRNPCSPSTRSKAPLSTSNSNTTIGQCTNSSTGQETEIVNNRFYEQYHRLLEILKYKANPDGDVLAATYYYFLRTRGRRHSIFRKNRPATGDEKLQYDYLASYVAFYKGGVAGAETRLQVCGLPGRALAPALASVSAQVKEIERGDARGHRRGKPRAKDRELAATEPAFDFEVEER